ncbi:circadian-associated transcriptional repressor [Rhineura floridana]|uniref:circadian-associated transcriptional repressor n=1 Tax=Rhineura floridana TaxID=261503 RepID=UPI002AC8233A|nr:circadian-associated transcriptional repressor [Rhineura floridana]XP_061462576.1 circadian-associated transcriptional repressor [Rhineura floridana]
MANMESSKSVSSSESLYSIESATSEEEDDEQRCGDFNVFLSDSGSDAEKEVEALRHRREAYPEGTGFLFSPESGRADPGLLCRDRKRRTRKPLGLLAAARLRPMGSCCRYPVVLDESCYNHLVDTDGSLPRNAVSQKRTESGRRKRQSDAMGDGQPHKYPRQRSSGIEDREDLRSPCWTEGDHLFAQKCWELQGFIHPLVGLLNRLKTGRFDRGLSSFQQSVAMDRIQRIIGVLQKPEMGERYLGTLLQVERMLKLWFPHVALKNACPDCSVMVAGNACEKQSSAEARLPPSRDPLHHSPVEELYQPHLVDPVLPGDKPSTHWGETPCFLGDWPAVNLTWIHTSPISNPPLGHVDFSRTNPVFGQALLGPNPSAYGVVVFLQSNTAVPAPFGRSTSVSPGCVPTTRCRSNRLRLGPGDLPRCQSLPGATVASSHLPRGTLGCLSQSLPCLPTSSKASEGRDMADRGRPAYYCDS